MMKTCRILHREGAKALLNSNDVSLADETQFASFLLFMAADPHVRVRFLRNLTLRFDEKISSEAGEALRYFFLDLASVEYNSLSMLSLDNTEKLLLAVPKLSVAIARLTTLKSIHLRGLAGPQGSRMLSKVCSRLTSACVSFDRNIHRLSNVTRNHYDPLFLLEHSKDTLKSLEIDNTLLLRIVKPRFKRVYPDLTSLTLSGIWISCAAGLYRTFPNLRKMEIRDGEPAVANSEYERWRASQSKSQEDYGSWQILESFFGSLVNLYLLCPGCRIEYVHIDSEQDTVDAAMLRNVLAEARPTRLKLGTWPDSFLDEDWLGALSEQRHPKLQVLDMLMMVLYDSDEIIGYALLSVPCELCALISIAQRFIG